MSFLGLFIFFCSFWSVAHLLDRGGDRNLPLNKTNMTTAIFFAVLGFLLMVWGI